MEHNVPDRQIAKVERWLRGVHGCDELMLLRDMLRPAALAGEAQPPSLLLLDLLEAEIERRTRP